MKRVLVALCAGVVLGIVGLVAVLWLLISPTHGPKIGSYANPRRALVVIDIQEDYTGPNARRPYRDAERLVSAANRLIDASERLGMDVVYIANEIDGRNPLARLATGGTTLRGDPGANIDARIRRIATGSEFRKSRPDAFSNEQLDRFLRERQVDELYLVGLDAAFCVGATARGALNRGYRVTVVGDAVATESGRPLQAVLDRLRDDGARIAPEAEVGAPRVP